MLGECWRMAEGDCGGKVMAVIYLYLHGQGQLPVAEMGVAEVGVSMAIPAWMHRRSRHARHELRIPSAFFKFFY